jgi:hypothetical protein
VISFTAVGAKVAANLSGSDVVLLGAGIDSLPFQLWSIPSIKQPEDARGRFYLRLLIANEQRRREPSLPSL